MTATEAASGSAARHGDIWGVRGRDWALNEEQQLLTYEAAIERVGIGAGQRVLDVGSGVGVFLRAAADRGAQVSGIDASETLVALARANVPEADLRVGDLQFLPFEDDWFDVVTGFNAFFFAADMVAALREAGRVAKPGARVVIQVWGPPERCSLTDMKRAFRALMPGPEGPPVPDLSEPGLLEGITSEAGLTPEDTFDVSWAYEFPDEDTVARAMLSPGLVVEAIRVAGEEQVRAAILGALEPYRDERGAYHLENEFRFVIARA